MKSLNTTKPAALLVCALLPILAGGMLSACNKKDAPKSESMAQEQKAPAAAPIQVTGNDQMQYSLKAFEVAAGSDVVVVMTNVGTLAKEVMGHNLTILNPGTVVADFAIKAMAAKETGFIPATETASILAHTRLLGPGESDTLRFTAPAAGEYPYLCTFPGHFAVMQGVMTVK